MFYDYLVEDLIFCAEALKDRNMLLCLFGKAEIEFLIRDVIIGAAASLIVHGEIFWINNFTWSDTEKIYYPLMLKQGYLEAGKRVLPGNSKEFDVTFPTRKLLNFLIAHIKAKQSAKIC